MLGSTIHVPSAAFGAAAVMGMRTLLPRMLAAKFGRDLARLNAGDPSALLAAYADDAVLRFPDGDHRWAGEHRGKPAIAAFLEAFAAAGLRGELVEVWAAGPPWAMTLIARFDDRAHGPDGEQIYRNRVVLVLRTRWGKVVEHEDFFEDTSRIEQLESRLQALGR